MISSSSARADALTHKNAMREYNFDPFSIQDGRENCTVGHLREIGKEVDVSPRANLGGLKTESMDLVGEARRPVTSEEIKKMLAPA